MKKVFCSTNVFVLLITLLIGCSNSVEREVTLNQTPVPTLTSTTPLISPSPKASNEQGVKNNITQEKITDTEMGKAFKSRVDNFIKRVVVLQAKDKNSKSHLGICTTEFIKRINKDKSLFFTHKRDVFQYTQDHVSRFSDENIFMIIARVENPDEYIGGMFEHIFIQVQKDGKWKVDDIQYDP